jgi:polysaccharide biosynthesis protein PslJ
MVALTNLAESQERERTPWLLAFLCLIIPLLPSYVVPLGIGPLMPVLVIGIGLLGLVILGFIVVGRRTERIQTVKPGVILILVYFLLVLTMWLGQDPKTQFLTQLEAVGIALYTMTRITTTRQRSMLLGVLVVGMTLSCIVAILQSYMNIDLRLLFKPPGFTELTQGGFKLMPGQSVNNVGAVGRFSANRSYGMASHPMEFSALAAAAVPLTIHFARFAANRLTRLLATVGIGVALIGILAGGSRTGLVALAAALLLYIWAFELRDVAVAVAVGTAVLGGIAALIGSGRVSSSAQGLWTAITEGASLHDVSILARVDRYGASLQSFRDHPLFGLGPGKLPSGVRYFDNQWLYALVDGGIVGVASMMVLAGGGLFGVAASLRRVRTRRERDQVYAIGAAFTSLFATSFTFDLFAFNQALPLLFFAFGLLWSTVNISIPKS